MTMHRAGDPLDAPVTAFIGHRRLAAGTLAKVAAVVRRAAQKGPREPILVFDDATGRVIDLDTRGTAKEMLARLAASSGAPEETQAASAEPEKRGPGRPKLGVVAREVTLLPRHWEWLNAQPGGASVALRKLVDDARRTHGQRDRRRAAHEAAFRFMSAIAGDFASYEEAARALFADDRDAFTRLVAHWPRDVREHAVALGFPA